MAVEQGLSADTCAHCVFVFTNAKFKMHLSFSLVTALSKLQQRTHNAFSIYLRHLNTEDARFPTLDEILHMPVAAQACICCVVVYNKQCLTLFFFRITPVWSNIRRWKSFFLAELKHRKNKGVKTHRVAILLLVTKQTSGSDSWWL